MANVAESSSNAIGRLEEASQQHEVNIVIDLGMDRLLKWIGVYLILILAALSKISDYIGTNLSCYPTNKSSGVGGEFIAFTTTYCWEANHAEMKNNSACTRAAIPEEFSLLDNPNDIKFFIQWIPYFMLAQGFLFSLPWAYWHFRVGARLLGHLKFMQLLLNDIFIKVQQIPEALYRDKPYDETSRNFDGRRLYRPERAMVNTVARTADGTNNQETPLLPNQTGTALEDLQHEDVVVQVEKTSSKKSKIIKSKKKNESDDTLTRSERLLVGGMKDRHFFSMLCFENFASMHHLPYILSVFKLCPAIQRNDDNDPGVDFYQLNESMLYQWCHRKNFNNVFLVKTYFRKHLFTAFLAFLMLLAMAVFTVGIADDVRSSETFRCPLPYEELCLLCTIKRKRDVFAMFCVDIFLTFLVFGMSIGNWLVVRFSENRATCHYFDQMKETCNVALLAASKAKND
ncbi:uncharacterized protein LOC143446612 [Clavelina lepadiformis]|uniref:Innexin n=1 Tax=Clavelina lepadiformis TaxID=159417 RepID=A0ABP0GUZ5_CLALP